MGVTLRKFPYPYLGAMSVCSDIDHCQLGPRRRGNNFEDTHIFINTKDESLWGIGVGLDIGDSFFMYNQAKYFADIELPSFSMNNWTNINNARAMSYYDGLSTSTRHKEQILRYIKSGWIDVIHSYGDFSLSPTSQYLCTREMSLAACQELVDNGVKLDVWIDHGTSNNKQNIVVNVGGNPTSEYYHTDVTIPDLGIRFVWDGAESNALETLLTPITLADGQKLWSFPRYYGPASDGVTNWQMKYFHEQITEDRLNEIKTGKYMIVAQHFGAHNYVWPSTAINAWRMIAQEWEAGNILVTRVSRLLKYNLAQEYVDWEYDTLTDVITINNINDTQIGVFIPSIDDIRGLSWDGTTSSTRVFIGDIEIEVSHPIENVTMVDWFEPDLTNYTGKLLQMSYNRRLSMGLF